MGITELLSGDGIALNVAAKDKQEVIDRLVQLQDRGGALSDANAYREAILRRENQGSTAVEAGIAVPHAKASCVQRPSLAAMTLTQGVDCGAMDGKPSDLFFMIAAPETGGDVHLQILSRLMVLLMDPAFADRLRSAKTAGEFLAAIDEAEREKYGDSPDSSSGEFRVLAVTACPTGIAHTFMAEEALNKAAKKLDVKIKVETNGSGGVKNRLTRAEIEEADGVIVAADKTVETARFHGKKVIFVPVSDGIHKAEELIRTLQSGQVAIYHSGEARQGDESSGSYGDSVGSRREGAGRTLYKHLMNGVSHMLPFVIGGGILIALAFLLDDYAMDPANFGMNTPIAAFFKTVGGAAFSFMLPVLAAYIAESIADRPGLAVGFVGGYLASVGNSFWNITGEGAISGGFLAALLAGFAGGYIVLLLRKLSSVLPASLEGIKPVLIYPLVGIFLMGALMFLVNPVMASINAGITDVLNNMGGVSKIALGCVVGGMMSIDMGGPFNKAAYVFGTASIATGNYDIMAAVMVGGMIPPLAIALCATFFKKKFTEDQRKSAFVNYIMGLCFITEGAIPFAAADPLRVLPSCIVGSAVAGGLSMALGCTLRAPHGGIFVFPVVGNVLGYIVALAVGSVVGMAMLALLKRNRQKGD